MAFRQINKWAPTVFGFRSAKTFSRHINCSFFARLRKRLLLFILILNSSASFGAEEKAFKSCSSLISDLVRVSTERPELSGEEVVEIAGSDYRRKIQAEIASIVDAWQPSKFTDPRSPKSKFLYLVHGILDDAELENKYLRRTRFTNASQTELERGFEKHSYQIKALIENPNMVSNFPGMSASVIDFDRPETYANSGFILQPNLKNIFATHSYDMGGRIESLRGLMQRNETFPIDTPQNILDATTYRYNEIALAGTLSLSAPDLKVIGLYVKTNDHGQMTCSPRRWGEFQELERKWNLPIVFIRDQASANISRW